MTETVVYLDFGTKLLHLGRSFQGLEADIAKCGLGAAFRSDSPRPVRFKDRPGLFSGEMCNRCLSMQRRDQEFEKAARSALQGSGGGE